jgi:hypothetical protein
MPSQPQVIDYMRLHDLTFDSQEKPLDFWCFVFHELVRPD